MSKLRDSTDCHMISPAVVGCLLKKGLQQGGHRYPRTTPSYAFDLQGDFHTVIWKRRPN